MLESLYHQYNPWWEVASYQPLGIIERPNIQSHLRSWLSNRSIILLTGLRRVGKTTLMRWLIQSLLAEQIAPKHIFYISLDDYLLKNLSILDILTEYRKLHQLSAQQKIYVFLDEVGFKQNFRQQLKNIYDTQNIKIYASSSSASIYHDEKGFLTGREIIIEVPPLNFEEFLRFRKVEIKKSEDFLKESYFEEYLQIGGMPEYVLNPQREYLTALVDDILYKDIVAFHGIKNPTIIKDYFALLMERVGKKISLNKVANILGISADTAKRYLNMFEETYLIGLIPRYGKLNDVLLSQKKVYATDIGIRNLFTGFRDKGAAFENVVYSAIKSLRPKYYLQDGIEIDFFTENKILIESKYNLTLQGKQLDVFNALSADERVIIQNIHDLEKFVRSHIEH